MKITIPVHSFVDLITNSSSETFIGGSASTESFIRKVLGRILVDNGLSHNEVSDVFKIDYYRGNIGIEIRSDFRGVSDSLESAVREILDTEKTTDY